uniref:HDC06110 n=1 Tax=Drosophila melanogaster TaxID=7227 RepID=Q6IGK1_DROME|nr:TPA_inf: HDC06110 [Drosophila melanogaster]
MASTIFDRETMGMGSLDFETEFAAGRQGYGLDSCLRTGLQLLLLWLLLGCCDISNDNRGERRALLGPGCVLQMTSMAARRNNNRNHRRHRQPLQHSTSTPPPPRPPSVDQSRL